MASRLAAVFVSNALGLWLYSTSSDAAVTHTTANQLEVRPFGKPQGEGSHSRWCCNRHPQLRSHLVLHGWAGHEGYVHSDYVVHHVTVVVALLVHEVHVHEHHVHHHHESSSARRSEGGFERVPTSTLRIPPDLTGFAQWATC
jgi:hypothetical protein